MRPYLRQNRKNLSEPVANALKFTIHTIVKHVFLTVHRDTETQSFFIAAGLTTPWLEDFVRLRTKSPSKGGEPGEIGGKMRS